MNYSETSLLLALYLSLLNYERTTEAFLPNLCFTRNLSKSLTVPPQQVLSPLRSTPPSFIIIVGDDDDDENSIELEEEEEEEEEDEVQEDTYKSVATSEFEDEKKPESSRSSALATLNPGLDTTMMDWGGALGKLRQRVEDIETGKSQDPSHVLFRMMSSQTPNQIIGQFITSANPQVVQAMSGAVGSLLGGLSNPNMGIETLVKASGEKIGTLCFQLQMTGYMFRNAEYVLALKDLMNLGGQVSLQDYKEAFDRLDTDASGYIELSEIQKLFDAVYEGKAPQFEANAFLQFFDQNKDGKISWNEFETGLGTAMATQMKNGNAASQLLRAAVNADSGEDGDDDDDDDDDEAIDISAEVSGTIEIEFQDGNVVEVEAKEYIESLKEEARALKEALRKEKLGDLSTKGGLNGDSPAQLLSSSHTNGAGSMDLVGYIASRQGDVKSLTEGISPEIVETMKRLVDFVLEGGDSGKAKKNLTDSQRAQMEMEIPGSALQQLALWQLVLGYRLREAEVTGEYMKLLD